ncbi:hypothetical protein VUR80DRAFT_2974 [Thermomyces stellatus]
MNASVLGIQSVGVQACSKHYIGNEQETQRTSTTNENGITIEAVSSNIDKRTLHELYVWPFANAVKAGTSSIMCSYNRVNGQYACANPSIMSILKDDLAFPGYVVSDWYATHGTAEFANAGLDIEMPGNVSALAGLSYFGESLLEAVQNHTVSGERLDDMVERVMRPYFRLHQDEDYPSLDPSSAAVFQAYQSGHDTGLVLNEYPMIPARNVRSDHGKLIRELGAAATVLLKNVNNTLPLRNCSEVGVFGNAAGYPTIGSVFRDYGDHPEGFEMGTVDIGGGSGTVRHTKLITPLEAVKKQVESDGGRVQVLLDNTEVADGRFRTIYPIPDVCLLFLKSYATEGQDRAHIDLQWNATSAVESTAAVCPNTVVVVHGPGVVRMPWADNENVTAILSAHYPGEEIGNSIVDVLWGATPPSGRLPYTIPKSEEDYGPPIVNFSEPVTDPDGWHADFDEGQMIDYRNFDFNNIEPQFEFGFGLAYTEFQVTSDIDINITPGLCATPDKSKGIAPGGLKDLWSPVVSARIKITNSGRMAGFAVPQLYVAFPQESTPKDTPVKVLRGFEKVHIHAGDTKEVNFELLRRDLSFWDGSDEQWVIPDGELTLMIGFSSRDIRAETKFVLLG